MRPLRRPIKQYYVSTKIYNFTKKLSNNAQSVLTYNVYNSIWLLVGRELRNRIMETFNIGRE